MASISTTTTAITARTTPTPHMSFDSASSTPTAEPSTHTLSSSRISTTKTTMLDGTSMQSSPVPTTSTEILWGPAITASPLPTSTLLETAKPSRASSAHVHFSQRSQRIVIATTVIGGVLLLASLTYILLRRRRGATYSEIAHFRRHQPSTIILDSPMGDGLTALPIYRESRYSVRSSNHASLMSLPKSLKRTLPVPANVARTFRSQNAYVKAWRAPQSPATPRTPLREAHTFLEDATPDVGVRKPEQARLDHGKSPASTHWTQLESRKSTLTISVNERPTAKATDVNTSPPGTPESTHNLCERWSWTNSQAPTTPRIAAPSSRYSTSSLSRLRRIRSWVKTQHSPKPPGTSITARKKPTLKNKAALPTLAPPVQNRLSKARPALGRDGLPPPIPVVPSDGTFAVGFASFSNQKPDEEDVRSTKSALNHGTVS